MAIALLMVAWSQVTITDPLPDLIAASSTKDHVTVCEDPPVCGATPAAVLRTRVGDQYSIEHVCRRPDAEFGPSAYHVRPGSTLLAERLSCSG